MGLVPTLITAYGGFGVRLEPSWDPIVAAWLAAGGRIAWVHARGDGEYGPDWAAAGRGAGKSDTVDDLCAAGNALQELGEAGPGQLAALAASNGGLVLSAALVRTPRLFSAVACAAPLTPRWLDQVITALGLTERLTHRPGQLSGGQQQRVACARALAGRPQIIFADEPTGNLDTRSSAEVLSLLAQMVRNMGQTNVMVTHDPVAATYADRVVFLADGRIVEAIADNDGLGLGCQEIAPWLPAAAGSRAGTGSPAPATAARPATTCGDAFLNGTGLPGLGEVTPTAWIAVRAPGRAVALWRVDGVAAVQLPGERGDIGAAIGAVEVVRQIDAVALADGAAGEACGRAL